MPSSFDSIYPDFLRTGLGRMHALGVGRELSGLFTALEHFRRDIHDQENATGILKVTNRYIAGLDLFDRQAYYIINPKDLGFEMELCDPLEEKSSVDNMVQAEMRAGKFGWALRQTSPVLVNVDPNHVCARGVFHSMGIARQTVGMFFGLLQEDRSPSQEISFNLLSMLLGTCTDALAALHRTTELKNEIHALSGLLPMCAWCKKIRDDQGYWAQLESYIESHTEAVFSHGACPDCFKKMMNDIPKLKLKVS